MKKGPYGNFAGHDASINLAKMTHEASTMDKWGSIPITEQEEKTLNDWVEKLEKKYRKVGNVIR